MTDTPVPPAIDPANAALLSNLRQGLVLLGGLLAAHGVIGPKNTITPENWEFIVGALVTLAPFAYSWFGKFRAANNAKAREAIAVQAGISLVTQGAALAVDGSKIVVANSAPPIPVTVKSAAAIIANFAPATVAKV